VKQDSYSPDDLSFLLSRRLDGDDLSPDESARLDEALRTSPVLRREAEHLETIRTLISRWGQRIVEPEAADDPGLRKVDGLLRRWGEREPAELDLSEQVLHTIGAKRRVMPRGLVFRLGVPLAAAAAIAIAALGPWFTPRESIYVAIGQAPIARAVSSAEPQVVVSFALPTELPTAEAREALSVGSMIIGVETVVTDEGSSL